MLSAAGGEGDQEESSNYGSQGFSGVLSSSSPSSKSSSSASASPLSSTLIPTTKTMEEVWKDITLASLHDHDRPSRLNPTTNATLRGLTFLDFLSRPHSKNPPPATLPVAAGYGSPASPPVVALTLNSGPDKCDLLSNFDLPRANSFLQLPPVSSTVSSLNVSFDALASSSSFPSLGGKKRFQESDGNSSDRRHKRMIKNRESAARSRARKQAYTNELELEVAHLMEENAKLKRQQQQLCLAADAQVPKKNNLHRSRTAPL